MSNNYPELIEQFFNALRRDSLHLVAKFYAVDARFEDPLGVLQGAAAIEAYYANLYQNVSMIRFDFGKILVEGDRSAAPWIMHLAATKLNAGKEIAVAGISMFEFDPLSSQARYHRDYFDMGAFVYEHIPILKHAIGVVKSRLKH